jgi:hypothetical protein
MKHQNTQARRNSQQTTAANKPQHHQQHQYPWQKYAVHISEKNLPPPSSSFSAKGDVVVALPSGRKMFLWMGLDYSTGENSVILVSRNAHTPIESSDVIPVEITSCIDPTKPTNTPNKLYYGTLLSGVYSDEGRHRKFPQFIADDCFAYCGTSMSRYTFQERLEYGLEVISSLPKMSVHFSIANMYKYDAGSVSESVSHPYPQPKYKIHHWQLRTWTSKPDTPYYFMSSYPIPTSPQTNPLPTQNQNPAQIPVTDNVRSPTVPRSDQHPTHSGHIQTNTTTIATKPATAIPSKMRASQKNDAESTTKWFIIAPEEQCDVYSLYATENGNEVRIGYAGIITTETSKLLNRVCRGIDKTLDEMEESDCEEDDDVESSTAIIPYQKYTQQPTNKQPQQKWAAECAFHPKFRRWVPIRVTSIATPGVPTIARTSELPRTGK